MKQYFVTGTDTGVGKTVSSAILALAMNAHYWKPIQSGLADEMSDRERVQQLTGFSDSHFFSSNYALQASLSPHQAAKLENVEIDLSHCQMPTQKTLIVEGAGGVFVPVNENHSMLDLMHTLNIPTIIVSRGTLGTINHTLLTISALRSRNIAIEGIIFSGELHYENQLTIEKWGKVRTLFHVPFFSDVSQPVLKNWLSQQPMDFL